MPVMRFGSTSTFAIDAMVEPDIQPPSAVWGRMRVWCDGVALGDYDEPHCALYGAYTGFKVTLSELRSLWEPEFDTLSDHALMNHLDALLYGYHGDVRLDDHRSQEQCENDRYHYGRYDFLTNWGEQFDRGGKSFITCKANGRVQILNPKTGKTLSAPVEEVEKAIDAFLRWFDEEAERLLGNNGR